MLQGKNTGKNCTINSDKGKIVEILNIQVLTIFH